MIFNFMLSTFVKIVVTVPITHADIVRQAIGEAGGGKIGAYGHCSFSFPGTGRFLPLDGAKPAIGKVGRLEQVEEERIEITVERTLLQNVVKAIQGSHPYEKIALDIYPLEDVDF